MEAWPCPLAWGQFSQRLLLHGQIGVEIPMGRVATVMTEPQGNRRNVHASLEQMHGGGVPHHMRCDVLGGATRTRDDGALDGLLSHGINPIARERLASGTRKGDVRSTLTQLPKPGSQPLSGVGPEWHGALRTALPKPRQAGAVVDIHLSPPQCRDFGDPCATVVARQEQRMIAPADPWRSIRRCQEGLYCRSRRVADQFLVLTLQGHGQHSGDAAAAVRIPQGHEAEHGPDGRAPEMARPHGVAPLLRQIGEKAAHDRGLNIGHPQRRWFNTGVIAQHHEPSPERIPTAEDGLRTAPSLLTEVIGKDGLHLGCNHRARPGVSRPLGYRSQIGVRRRSAALAPP